MITHQAYVVGSWPDEKDSLEKTSHNDTRTYTRMDLSSFYRRHPCQLSDLLWWDPLALQLTHPQNHTLIFSITRKHFLNRFSHKGQNLQVFFSKKHSQYIQSTVNNTINYHAMFCIACWTKWSTDLRKVGKFPYISHN